MKNKEEVYDNIISPLMKQIIATCKENDIKFFADFELDNGMYAKSVISNKNEGHIIMTVYDILSQCKEEGGVNVDKFCLSLIRLLGSGSSIYLNFGAKPDTYKPTP